MAVPWALAGALLPPAPTALPPHPHAHLPTLLLDDRPDAHLPAPSPPPPKTTTNTTTPTKQVVLLNLLIAVMSETWSNIKEYEEVEWKLLSVSSIGEFFELHHVPPPFNCVQLLRHLYRHLAHGSDLPHHATSSPPLLSREDIKKRAKTAQLKVLEKQRQEAAQLPHNMLEQLGCQQREMADRIEKLAGAADRTSSELRQLAVERRAAQFERRGNGNASAGSTRTLPPILARGGSAPGLERTSGRSPSPLRVAAHVKRAEV